MEGYIPMGIGRPPEDTPAPFGGQSGRDIYYFHLVFGTRGTAAKM